MLGQFLIDNRDEIVERCRSKVSARRVLRTLDADPYGIPLFLDQLIGTLQSSMYESRSIRTDATSHGYALLQQGVTIAQVVHDYGDVCQAVTELAFERHAEIPVDEFRTLNRCLDDAIADAVTEYAHQRDQLIAKAQVQERTERLGFFAHELRNLVNTISLAFGAIRDGRVGVSGSTGTVLERNLVRIRRLIDQSLADVRISSGAIHRERVVLASFLEEVEAGAALDASAHTVRLSIVPPGDVSLAVEADRQILAAVVGNLIQNAIKFTKPTTTVTVTVRCTDDRVLIDIADECGGLPEGNPEELFRLFEQRAADRTGAGLGLAISQAGAHANAGVVLVRDLPGKGCVFTVDLPRQMVAMPLPVH